MPATQEPPTTAAHDDLVVHDLRSADFDEAAVVIGRGMRDNPIHVAAYGLDPRRRQMVHTRLMRLYLSDNHQNEAIGVWRDGKLLAVAGVAMRGSAAQTMARALEALPMIGLVGPRTAASVTAWRRAWLDAAPDEPHAHLGPVAVDLNLQGQGIGTVLMEEHVRRLDESGTVGFLETDKLENVSFYERFGYEVVGQETVLGVPCWYMRREPA